MRLTGCDEENKRIGKKQYHGDKSLRSFVIPEGTTEIGDWAFFGCGELRKIALPVSVWHIGKDAFSGWEKLNAATLYGGDKPFPGRLEMTLAVALHFFPEADQVILAGKEGEDRYLTAWDLACHRFLEKPDDEGYRPFFAGGEEDYEEEETGRDKYCQDRRRVKADIALVRLLASKRDGEYYLTSLRNNDKALECLANSTLQPGPLVEIYEEAKLLTAENCRSVLEILPEEKVELRAILLQKITQRSQSVLDKLLL